MYTIAALSFAKFLLVLLIVTVIVALRRGRKGAAVVLGLATAMVALIAVTPSIESQEGIDEAEQAAQAIREAAAELQRDVAEARWGRRTHSIAIAANAGRTSRSDAADNAPESSVRAQEPDDADQPDPPEPMAANEVTYGDRDAESANAADQDAPGRARPAAPLPPAPPASPSPGPRRVRPGLWLERLPVRLDDDKLVIDARAVLPRPTDVHDPAELPTEKEIAHEIRNEVRQQIEEFFEIFTTESRPQNARLKKLHADLRKLDAAARARLARALAERKTLRQREVRDIVVPGIGPSYERDMVAEFPTDQLHRLILEQHESHAAEPARAERDTHNMVQFLLLILSLAVGAAWLRSATNRHILGPSGQRS